MAAQTVTIDISSRYPAEVSAEFFALLIHPENDSAREQLVAAEMNRQIRYWAKIDPEGVDVWQCWPPKYLLFAPELAEKLHKQAMDAFNRKRMIAAQLARVFVVEALVRGAFVRRKGIELIDDGERLGEPSWENLGLWGLRQQRRLVRRPDHPDKVHWKTIQARTWARSKPVLHLAAAFQTMLHGSTEAARQASWAEVFNDRQKTETLFMRAELWRVALIQVARNGRIKLAEEEMISVVAK